MIDIPDHVRSLLRQSVSTPWGLDLLLLLKARPERLWTVSELAAELRGSNLLVEDNLRKLTRAGLVEETSPQLFRYFPKTGRLDQEVEELQRLYIRAPLTVIREIVRAPNEKIQSFVDAFRFKE